MLIVNNASPKSIELDKLFEQSNKAYSFEGIIAAENKTTATIYRLYAINTPDGEDFLSFYPVVGLNNSRSNDQPQPYRAWCKEKTENMHGFVAQASRDDRLQLHYFHTEMEFAKFLEHKIKGVK